MFRNRQVYPSGKSHADQLLFESALRELMDPNQGNTLTHHIGGEQILALGGETYPSVDPNKTNFVICHAPKHELKSPFERERLGQMLGKVVAEQERWWKVPYQKRIELLEALSD